MVSLAGASVPMVRVTRQVDALRRAPLACTVKVCEPGLASLRHVDPQLQADALVDARHRRRDRLAAAQDVGFPARRHAVTDSCQLLGRQCRRSAA